MEIKQLKTFIIAAKTLNFTKTSKILNYAQSTISDQILSLETELDTRLFERLGRNISLTKDGEAFLIYAQKILNLCTKAKECISGNSKHVGTLTIATTETLCIFRLPSVFGKYCNLYPDVNVSLKVGNCADFPNWIRENKVDVAFVLDNEIIYPDLVEERLLHESLVVISSKNHPLAEKDIVDPYEFSGENLILTQSGCGYGATFQKFLFDENVCLGSILELESIEAIKQYVVNGFGIGFLPRVAVEKELTSGQLAELKYKGPIFYTSARILYHKDKWISPALKSLLELTKQELISENC